MKPYLPLIGALLAFTAAAEPFRVGAARVDITPAADASLPMGGYKQSGWGHERAWKGLEAYLNTKAVYVGL